MNKIYALLAGALAIPMLASAADYTPEAPYNVEYLTHQVQSWPLRDANGDKVSNYEGEYSFAENEYGEFRVARANRGKITCTIAKQTVDGGNITNTRLEYRILIQHKGQTEAEAQPLIFSGANGYIKWDQNGLEPMEWLGNTWTDAYDISVSSGDETEPKTHTINFYYTNEAGDVVENPADIEKIGVQSRQKRGSNYYESAVTWVEPTDPNYDEVLTPEQWLDLQKQYNPDVKVAEISVAGVAEYFDLQGRKVSGEAKGMMIKRVRMSDGKTVTSKVIR